MKRPFKTGCRYRLSFLCLFVGLAAGPLVAEPQTQSRELTGFRHVGWTSDNGGTGAAHYVGQTQDGYLWTGDAQGVYRFDGVRFESIDALTHGALRAADITNYLISSRGGLWVTSDSKGLMRYSDGRLVALGVTNCTPHTRNPALLETADGDLWIATFAGLFRMDGSKCERFNGEGTLPDGYIAGLFIDKDGTLWVKTDGELLYLRKNSRQFERNRFGAGKSTTTAFIRQGNDGAIWLSDDAGLRRVTVGSSGTPAGDTSLLPSGIASGTFFFARDGALWICASGGVRRIRDPDRLLPPTALHGSTDDLVTTAGGLTSDAVWDVFQDRESSIWIGTNSGLDRLTPNPIIALTLPHARETQYGVLPGDSGTVWTGSWDAPLTLASAEGIITYPEIPDAVISLRRDRMGTLWFSGGGTGQLWRRNGQRLEKVASPATPGYAARDVAVDSGGTPWLTLINGNIFRLQDGKWEKQDELLGKPASATSSLLSDAAGRIWIAFENQLILWDAGKISRYSSEQGLVTGLNLTLFSREDRLWMAGRSGVGLFSAGRFQLLKTLEPAAFGGVTGVVETSNGDVWINSTAGAFFVVAAEIQHWRRDSHYLVAFRRFAAPDGLVGSTGQRTPVPSVAEGGEGKIWFATSKGVFWTDPHMLAAADNPVPPPVDVTSISFEGKPDVVTNGLRVPIGTKSIEIGYAALSMVNPERVAYRYRLDGFEKEWQDAGGRREAYYTNLSPGSYRFHVIASNNSGVWNTSGASLSFVVQPKYFQTWWFRALCALSLIAVVAGLFKLRLAQATAQLRDRLAAQMGERERIARELHDTILQGFYGILLRFQAAIDQVPAHEPARAVLGRVLDSAEAIVNEGRDSVRDLRGESSEAQDLSEVFRNASQDHGSPPILQVKLEGSHRALHPVIYREICRIGLQAISNAYQHAAASKIMVTIDFGLEFLSVIVEDNGVGIEPAVADAGGRADHWGMKGMQERASGMEAHYRVRSRVGGGTVVECKIPAAVAYSPANPVSRRWRFRRR